MRVKLSALIVAAAVGLAGGQYRVMGQQAPAAGAGAPGLVQISKEFEDLYAQVSGAVVRVSVVQSPVAVLQGKLKTEFDDWVKTAAAAVPQPGRGPGPRAGGGRDERNGRAGQGAGRDVPGPRGGGGAGPGQGPGARGGGNSGGGPNAALSYQVSEFLRMKAVELDKSDPTLAGQYRWLSQKVSLNRNGFQGEMWAVVIDNDGHALLPVGLLREAHGASADPIKVTTTDGSVTTATFVGSNAFGGYSIVKIEKPQSIKPVKLSAVRVTPGELLMSWPAVQGVPGLVIASPKSGTGPVDDRFAVAGEDRNGSFIFGLNGELVAVVSGGGAGWLGDRQAIVGMRLQREVDFITKQMGPDGKPGVDIVPPSLGLDFKSLDESGLPKARMDDVRAVLKGRHGVVVTKIDKDSMAARTGLKEGDVIVTINGRNLTELVGPDGRPLPGLFQLRVDLVTRPGGVSMGVIRQENGKEVEEPLTATK